MGNKFFKEQPNGYDKKQVDKYIRKLMKAYQTIYKVYLDEFDKYRELLNID